MTRSEAPSNSAVFRTCFAAITATAFCFVLRALIIDDWGAEFALSETQKGELLGVGLWPFAISIVLLSLLIDRIGFRVTLWFAAICHVTGLALLLIAQDYWSLYAGTFIMALGNGAVEAAANPLIATVYAHDKPRWLNRLHAAWPGGMILGGLFAMALGGADWRLKAGLMAVPITVYALLLVRPTFPVSERVASGVSYRAMLAEAGFLSAGVIIALMMLEIARVFALPPVATLAAIVVLTVAYGAYARSSGRPLYIILVLIMIPLATTELSTDSWISSLMTPELNRLGLHSGSVLIYTSAIVFVVRLFAGVAIKHFTPLGVLAMASASAAAGLFMLASASGWTLLVAATIYGIGKSFFWGTSLAVVSEQFPRGGAVTINVVAGVGMLAAGIVGSVLLGTAQDNATARMLAEHDAAAGSHLSSTYLTLDKVSAFGRYRALDPEKFAQAPAADRAAITGVVAESKKTALRDVVLLPLVMLGVYLTLIVFFKTRGGYRPVVLLPLDNPRSVRSSR